MSAPRPERIWNFETRLCVAVFGLALALNVGLSAIGLENTLLGGYGFRQLQTAVTTQAFLRDGITLLDYATPLLGPPWEIPLEFPLFQVTVALFVRATGMELDLAGRFVSWLFFLSALPACYLLLGRFAVTPPRRLLFLAFLLLSPLYLYFSRAFMIESAALSFSCWFLFCFGRFLDRPRVAWFVGTAGFGALAGTIKVTTLAVFLIAALLLLFAALRPATAANRRRLWVLAGAAVTGPLAASIAWVIYTAGIRRLNPETALLEGHFGYWSFGDIPMRLSPAYWLRTYRVWADMLIGESGVLLIALYFCWRRGSFRWVIAGCLAAFLSGQLIFANLYWVHGHYFYASGVFLTAAVVFCVCEFLDRLEMGRVRSTILLGVLLALQLSAYHRFLYSAQKDNTPVPEYVEALKALTDPDEVIVVVGQDWEAVIPYYAERRAFMLVNGSENDSTSVRQRMSRLDGHRVGAVVVQGWKANDRGFADDALGGLELGSRPLFVPIGVNAAIWVPQKRQALMRDQFDPQRFRSLQIAPEENTTGAPRTIFARQISQRRGFDGFKPRPVRATSLSDFSNAVVDGRPVLTAHAISEVVFRPVLGATKLTGVYGLAFESYSKPGMTDGVEFIIAELRRDGSEHVLFQRYLNPASVPADRGMHSLEVALPAHSGEVVLRTLGGPNGSVAYDWSYWGEIRIE